MHTYIHTYIHTCMHACLPLSKFVHTCSYIIIHILGNIVLENDKDTRTMDTHAVDVPNNLSWKVSGLSTQPQPPPPPSSSLSSLHVDIPSEFQRNQHFLDRNSLHSIRGEVLTSSNGHHHHHHHHHHHYHYYYYYYYY